MSTLTCHAVREMFTDYLDGTVTGVTMQAIARHLEGCEDCHAEFEGLRMVQHSLSGLGTLKAPEDLGMRLRLAISHEKARSERRWMDLISVRWENTIRPLVMQASAGLAGSIVLVGGIMLLLGMVAAPEPVMANDEPLGQLTAPHYLYSAEMFQPIHTDYDATIVVEAKVNSQGKVYDFRIVSGPADAAVMHQVTERLLQGVFQPATVFGAPIRGQVVMTFAGISVQG
ncbi:MAG: zf-HC2 domain-containing protein [Acidobacteriota bacterium]|nr:zf-HC2 domain-containing protein [Acidobacteriota bacterium]